MMSNACELDPRGSPNQVLLSTALETALKHWLQKENNIILGIIKNLNNTNISNFALQVWKKSMILCVPNAKSDVPQF